VNFFLKQNKRRAQHSQLSFSRKRNRCTEHKESAKIIKFATHLAKKMLRNSQKKTRNQGAIVFEK